LLIPFHPNTTLDVIPKPLTREEPAFFSANAWNGRFLLKGFGMTS
jgi:hypothetical protein